MSRWALFGSAACLLLLGCVAIDDEVEHGSRAVIGGSPAQPGDFASTGALLSNGGVLCTGTLVAPDVVLTAAHCVVLAGSTPPDFTLALDATTAPASEIYAGASAHAHPDYNLLAMSQGLGVNYDVGLVILAEPVTGVAPALLPTPDAVAGTVTPGTFVDIVGYGVTEPTGLFPTGVKHEARTEVLELGSHELLLSKAGQPQNCRGDSGGPAFADLGSGVRLVGIVSRGEGGILDACDAGHGIDTRADAYLAWIHTLADLPCGSGLSPPCGGPDAGAIDDPDDVGVDAGSGGVEPQSNFTPSGCRATRAPVGPPAPLVAIAVLLFLGCRRRRRLC